MLRSLVDPHGVVVPLAGVPVPSPDVLVLLALHEEKVLASQDVVDVGGDLLPAVGGTVIPLPHGVVAALHNPHMLQVELHLLNVVTDDLPLALVQPVDVALLNLKLRF